MQSYSSFNCARSELCRIVKCRELSSIVSMLTLSANSETLVNDFNDLSIKSGDDDIHYDDSHKVSFD